MLHGSIPVEVKNCNVLSMVVSYVVVLMNKIKRESSNKSIFALDMFLSMLLVINDLSTTNKRQTRTIDGSKRTNHLLRIQLTTTRPITRDINTIHSHTTSAQVVKTTVTVTNSSFQNYIHPDDHTRQTKECITLQFILLFIIYAENFPNLLRATIKLAFRLCPIII